MSTLGRQARPRTGGSPVTTALLVIDVQQSFLHRPYWRDEEEAPFRTRLLELIAGCRPRGIPVLHVLHEEPGSGGRVSVWRYAGGTSLQLDNKHRVLGVRR